MTTVKEELTRFIQEQPDESSREEIVRELAFHVMVERGLTDSDANRTVSNDEMGRIIRAWRKYGGRPKPGGGSKPNQVIFRRRMVCSCPPD